MANPLVPESAKENMRNMYYGQSQPISVPGMGGTHVYGQDGSHYFVPDLQKTPYKLPGGMEGTQFGTIDPRTGYSPLPGSGIPLPPGAAPPSGAPAPPAPASAPPPRAAAPAAAPGGPPDMKDMYANEEQNVQTAGLPNEITKGSTSGADVSAPNGMLGYQSPIDFKSTQPPAGPQVAQSGTNDLGTAADAWNQWKLRSEMQGKQNEENAKAYYKTFGGDKQLRAGRSAIPP